MFTKTFTPNRSTSLWRQLRNRILGYLQVRLKIMPDMGYYAPKSQWQADEWEQQHDNSEVALVKDNQIICVLKLFSSGGEHARLGIKAPESIKIIRVSAANVAANNSGHCNPELATYFKVMLAEFHAKHLDKAS